MSKRMLMLTILLSTAALAFAKTGEIREKMPERPNHAFDHIAFEKSQINDFEWLASEQTPISNDNILRITLSPEEFYQLESHNDSNNQQLDKRFMVGMHKSVNHMVDFDHMTPADIAKDPTGQAGGVMQKMADQGFVWNIAVNSEDASALRVHFTDVNLPYGVEMFLYNLEGQVRGPYTKMGPKGDGEFWSHTIAGDTAFVQLRVHGEVSKARLDSIAFTIADIGHLGSKFMLPFYQKQSPVTSTHKACSFNEDCVQDGSCFSSGDFGAIDTVRDAVAHMSWISGAFIYICTGGLVADTDANTDIPYFLTANHCISRQRDADSLETYWFFQTTTCDGACISRSNFPSIVGATLLSTNSTGDYTLFQLDQTPPSGVAFLGWSTANVANSNGTQLYRLSHPQGAPQAYSEHEVDTSATTCSSWPRGSWIYSRDTVGATEGGSSGSPVLNGSGQIVGQLSGGCGFNINDVCDSVSNATVDGAFASYFSQVEQWLDPGTTPPTGGITLSVNGYKVKGKHTIDLTWSGASGSNVDIYRNGSFLTTTSNSGSYTDATNNKGGNASYAYEVCEAGTSTCSNTATANF